MAKDFVIRLKCPYGDEETWVVLQGREESLNQVLVSRWDFECSVHGAQREIPLEGSEKLTSFASRPSSEESTAASGAVSKLRSGPRISLPVPVTVYGCCKYEGSFQEETTTILVNATGGLVVLAAKVELGDTFFIVNKTTQEERECRVVYVAELEEKARVGFALNQPAPGFWRIDRKEERITKALRVLVRGVDRNGQPFAQSAFTVDFSHRGARLEGIAYLTWPGEIIQVKRRWRKARFRVVWVGEIGTPQAGQVGVFALELNKNIWGSLLPD